MITIFGFISLFCCVFFGPIAWIMGSGDLTEIQNGKRDESGEGLTKLGKILGMISTLLWGGTILISALIYVAFLILVAIGVLTSKVETSTTFKNIGSSISPSR